LALEPVFDDNRPSRRRELRVLPGSASAQSVPVVWSRERQLQSPALSVCCRWCELSHPTQARNRRRILVRSRCGAKHGVDLHRNRARLEKLPSFETTRAPGRSLLLPFDLPPRPAVDWRPASRCPRDLGYVNRRSARRHRGDFFFFYASANTIRFIYSPQVSL